MLVVNVDVKTRVRTAWCTSTMSWLPAVIVEPLVGEMIDASCAKAEAAREATTMNVFILDCLPESVRIR